MEVGELCGLRGLGGEVGDRGVELERLGFAANRPVVLLERPHEVGPQKRAALRARGVVVV